MSPSPQDPAPGVEPAGAEPAEELAAARARLEAARRELAALEARGTVPDHAVPDDAVPADAVSDGAVALSADDEADLAARRAEVTAATTSVFRTALRGMLLLVGAVAVLGCVVGGVLSGSAGVWGALLGAGVTLLFSGTTVLSMLTTTGTTPHTMAAVVLGGWIVKMAVLLGVLLALRSADFYDRDVFVVTLLVGAFGSALLDYRAVARGRVPYIVPQ